MVRPEPRISGSNRSLKADLLERDARRLSRFSKTANPGPALPHLEGFFSGEISGLDF
jgi:hypothetical protein